MGAGEAKRVHQGDDVAAEVGQGIGPGRNVRAAMAARVETHDEEFFGEIGGHIVPDGEIGAEWMGEDHGGRFARAFGDDIEGQRASLHFGHCIRPQINFIARIEAWPLRPTMRWSCSLTPSGLARAAMVSVMVTSAVEGVGSPEG